MNYTIHSLYYSTLFRVYIYIYSALVGHALSDPANPLPGP